MKLLYCPVCNDVVKLASASEEGPRTCKCGRSRGRYVDNLEAEYEGMAIPIGMDNQTLLSAITSYVYSHRVYGIIAHTMGDKYAEHLRKVAERLR